MWRKGNPFALLVGIQTGAATVENSMEFSHKTKNGTALLPSHFTSGNRSKETQNTDWKKYMHAYDHCSTLYNSQYLEVAQCPSVAEWIQQLWYIFTME